MRGFAVRGFPMNFFGCRAASDFFVDGVAGMELVLIAVGLSMDAFAVALCRASSTKPICVNFRTKTPTSMSKTTLTPVPKPKQQ